MVKPTGAVTHGGRKSTISDILNSDQEFVKKNFAKPEIPVQEKEEKWRKSLSRKSAAKKRSRESVKKI